MTFIIELPADEHGNRTYTNGQAMVIEIEQVDQWIASVIAPREFYNQWPTIAYWGDYLDKYKVVNGPARLLDEDEYNALISNT